MNIPLIHVLLMAIFAPAAFGALTLCLPRRAITARVLIALFGLLTSVGALLMVGVQPDAVPTLSFVPSMHMDLVFNPDQLGVFFALLVAGVGALIVIYARGYFGPDEDSLYRFLPTLGLFASAMLGIVLSDNMLGMFLFWELTSVSSFLLIGWNREDRHALLLAIQAFVVTGLGGLSLLGGILLMGHATDAWTFRELLHVFSQGTPPNPGLVTWACLMIFIGCATKSAQWPFHFWLPGAMAAPTPVSAYLHSATMVKAGVYLVARLFPIIAAWLVYWGPTLVIFGALTMLLGGYLAVRSAGLKKIFAYTTVSQLGLLMCMYGLGAFHGGGHGEHGAGDPLIFPVTQILNHALYKAPLFIIAGAIIHICGKTELPQLKGLWKTHRILAIIALAAGYALAGGPMTLSFTMKEAFFYQIEHAAHAEVWIWMVGGMAVATAICNVMILVRMATTFFAAPEPTTHDAHDEHHAHEHGLWAAGIWWPAAAIVLWQFVGGFAPGLFETIFGGVETNVGSWEHLSYGSVWHAISHPGVPLFMSLTAIGLGVVLGLSPLFRRPQADFHNELFPGYFRGMQYFGHVIFSRFQSGSLRQYFLCVLGALLLGLAGACIMEPDLLRMPEVAPLGSALLGLKLASFLLTGLICATALMMPFTERRIVRVLMLGACGFSVTGMYLLYQAPDLALTQLMCEIIGVVLFLLVLRLLPEESEKAEKHYVPKLPRAAFALLVGVSIGWIVLQAGSVADQRNIEIAKGIVSESEHHAAAEAAMIPVASGHGHGEELRHGERVTPSDYASLGQWFEAHSYDGTVMTEGRGGGGTNIVNVILVDFRGYDTLGEITVLAITVMGILSLLSSVPPTRIRGVDPTVCYVGAQPQLRSILLHTAMRLVLPLALVFAAYIFFKGHNQPGGGFIAGLIASVGLAVYRMTEGFDALKRIVPIRPGHLAATGLSLALGTGLLVPMLLMLTGAVDDAAFLRSWHGYIPLFGGAEYHLTTVMFFDLGVFLCVVGASMGIINRLEEELE